MTMEVDTPKVGRTGEDNLGRTRKEGKRKHKTSPSKAS